jgi:His/Glu/Gln/Arg/opine family amino acid ABC transporter permease subunit
MDGIILYAPLIARGTAITVALAVLAMALATLLGALGASGKLSRRLLPRLAAGAYTSLVRGVPDLVMLLLIYFGGQRLINVTAKFLGGEAVDVSKFWAGVFAIGFIYGAYLTETFRGAYLTVPRGQSEAARALGMHSLATIWQVVLPQLMRFALPGYANVFQVLVKSTAVVSIIGLEDLVGLTNDIGKTLRQPFTFFVVAFMIFLAITWASQRIFYWAERRYALKGHHAV